MRKRIMVAILLGLIALAPWHTAAGQQIKVATAIKSPHYFLPALAAQEMGFGKEAGVSIEWVTFVSGGLMTQAFMAKAIPFGISSMGYIIAEVARGVPLVITAELEAFELGWYAFARKDNSLAKPEDLKGKKIGVPRLGSLGHVYAQAIAKGAGLEKDVRYVALGGIPQLIAGLKARAVDAIVTTDTVMIPLEVRGETRRVAALSDYFPLQDSLTLPGLKDFVEKNPEMVKGAIQAVLKGADLVMKERRWSIAQMKAQMGWEEPVAEEFHRRFLKFSRDGAIYPSRLEGVRNFMIKFGLVAKEKTPAVAGFYTDRFVSIQGR